MQPNESLKTSHLIPAESSDFRRDALISFVSTLPPEIMSDIVTKFLPSYPEFPPHFGLFSPLLLSQICRHWRQIAPSTPSLWSAIRINILAGNRRPLAGKLQVVETWLARSRNYPLSLHFTGHVSQLEVLRPLVQTFVVHCERWKYDHLVIPFALLRLVDGDMPLLRDLTFGPSELELDVLPALAPFERAPQLTTVVLQELFLYSMLRLPWAQLPLGGSLSLRARMRGYLARRHESHILQVRCMDLDEHTLLTVVPVHSNLRHLILLSRYHHPDISLGNVLLKLTLPALRMLQISEPSITLDSIQAFIRRSQCALEELYLIYPSFPHSTYREVFPSIPSIIFDPPFAEDPAGRP
ncbi:hypothetical protein B0H19DRAFT_1103328 [Mycena capillaripes]|nr:hypothetical protein B0H19DRAFT_1103328 [Mycena capillaripes]